MIKVTKENTEFNIHYLEHMVHYSNLESIISNGLLSHNQAYQKGLIKKDISMDEVQRWRERKSIRVNDKVLNLHDFVSFYFNTKNPMLYRRKNIQDELAILLVDTDVLNWDYSIFTDGNAASKNTKFFGGLSKLDNVPLELIFSGSWNNSDPDVKKENVRKMCSEALIYPSVSATWIRKIVCPNYNVLNHVKSIKSKYPNKMNHIVLEIQSGYFF